MDNKTFGIGVMVLTAVVLMVANFMPLRPAHAGVAIKDRDYQLVTATSLKGGDVLYVADNRTGLVAAFVWDTAKRRIEVKDVQPIMAAFGRR